MAARVDVRHAEPRAIRRTVLRLAAPAVLEMMLHMSGWVVDTALVGRLGASQLAAVAMGGQVYFTLVFLFGAIGVGATALIARYTGAEDQEGASRAAGQVISLSLVLGVLAVLSVRLLSPLVFSLSALTSEVTALALRYTGILALGAIFQVPILGASGILRGRGDTRSPLLITLVSSTIAITSEYVLIFGIGPWKGLGFLGAAYGLLFGWIAGMLLSLAIVLLSSSRATTLRRILSWSPQDALQLMRLSVPAGLEVFMMDGARTLNMMLIGVLGTDALAAHQIVATSESLSFMPGFGFAIASSVIAGQALGAGDPQYARKGAQAAWRIAIGAMGTIGLTYVLFPGMYLRLFTSDPAVLAIGVTCLAIAGLCQPFVATAEVYCGVLRGSGDTRTSMLITIAGTWLIRVPLTFLVARRLHLGLPAVWAVMVLDWMLRSGLAWLRFSRGKWARVRV